MSDKPRVVAAWFMGDPVADDDPLRDIKLRALAHDQAAEMIEATERHGHAAARADQLAEAAALFADEAFDPRDVWDAAAAAGMGEAELDAAAHVAVVLEEVERRRRALRW